jgi:hypothetical protein
MVLSSLLLKESGKEGAECAASPTDEMGLLGGWIQSTELARVGRTLNDGLLMTEVGRVLIQAATLN